jgi:hypothetical protein
MSCNRDSGDLFRSFSGVGKYLWTLLVCASLLGSSKLEKVNHVLTACVKVLL